MRIVLCNILFTAFTPNLLYYYEKEYCFTKESDVFKNQSTYYDNLFLYLLKF